MADHAGLDKMVLVGFSMSGKFAQYLACEHPDRIAGLVLIAGTTAGKLPFPEEIQHDWVSRVGNREKLMSIFSPDVLRQTVMKPLPQARLAVLDCNHEIPIEQPQALGAVLQGFLAGLPQ